MRYWQASSRSDCLICSSLSPVKSNALGAIGRNIKAAFIQHGVGDSVKYTVAAAVVTLTGDVNSEAKRGQAAKVARSVPNVTQVVNELQVKDQKATSRGGGHE